MESTPDTARDAAWVTVATPFSPDELRGFLDDVERLFRINSNYVFEQWTALGDGRHRVRWLNQANKRTQETELAVSAADDGITVTYADGLKTATTFRVEAADDGTARLVVTDDYAGTPADERERRIAEVDQTLVGWGHDLYRYLKAWKTWGRLRPWRWYMRKVWQPMRPMARRVTALLIVITALEFVAFLAVFTIFALEWNRALGI